VSVPARGPALALCALLAVVPSLAQQTDLRAGLQAARAKWQQRQPSAYEFTLEARCFCIGIAKTPPTFRVRNGEPSTLTELDRDSVTFYSRRDTIDKLFAAIEWSLNRGQDNSIVRYDEEFGYPLLVELDPQRSEADDELALRVTNFRVIEMPRQYAVGIEAASRSRLAKSADVQPPINWTAWMMAPFTNTSVSESEDL